MSSGSDSGHGRRWVELIEQYQREIPSERRRSQFEIGDRLRFVINRLGSLDAPDDELARLAEELAGMAERFADLPLESRYQGFSEAANAGAHRDFFDHSPLMGRANPLAPPLEVWPVSDRAIEARVTFGYAYEGPPAHVHGGFIAAAFDEVLGYAQSMSGQQGMTAGLSVRYRSPTPVNEAVTFRCRFDRVEGRKVHTSGTLHAGDRLCAEAEALFISVDFDRFLDLKEGGSVGGDEAE